MAAAKKPVKKAVKKPAKATAKKAAEKPVKAAAKKQDLTPAGRASSVAAKVNSSLGYPAVVSASEVRSSYHLRRPTGIMDLDLDMGGGAPAGGYIALSGAENSGKTHLMYMMFAMHQRIYGSDSTIALAYTEWEPDYWQMRFAGMQIAIPDSVIADTNKARARARLPPFDAKERAELKRQIGTVHVVRAETSEQLLNSILMMIEADCYGIIGIDSLTMLYPATESIKDMEESENVRSRAQLITSFVYKMRHRYKGQSANVGNRTALVGINQVRANSERASAAPGMQRFIPTTKPSQTYAERHTAMMDIVLTSGEKVRSKKGGKSHVIGKQIKWLFHKGSKGAHDNAAGDTYFSYDTGIDIYRGILPAGMRCGLIRENNSRLTVYDGTGKPAMENINGPEHFVEIIKNDPALEMDIREQIVMKTRGETCIYR